MTGFVVERVGFWSWLVTWPEAPWLDSYWSSKRQARRHARNCNGLLAKHVHDYGHLPYGLEP